MDVPADQTVVPIDLHDNECNTTGAKGLGEPATIPAAPAIANAIYHAIGVRTAGHARSTRRGSSDLLAAAEEEGMSHAAGLHLRSAPRRSPTPCGS